MKSTHFHGLTSRNVSLLLHTIATSGIASTDHIKRIYSQTADHFETTLAFCANHSLCNVAAGSIKLSATGIQASRTCIKREYLFLHILNLLVEGKNRFARRFRMFLRCFAPSNGSLCWFPTPEQRGLYSDVRNFLMEGDALLPTSDRTGYAMNPLFADFYVRAKLGSRRSPKALQKRVESRTEFGDAAELAVFDFEKRRVGDLIGFEIKHVARYNTDAGFDILSATVNPDGQLVPRYIEVKAVSRVNHKFYWTKNEMAIARVFRENYFLYLVPYAHTGAFDTSSMLSIADPIVNVLESEHAWTIDEETVLCEKRPALD